MKDRNWSRMAESGDALGSLRFAIAQSIAEKNRHLPSASTGSHIQAMEKICFWIGAGSVVGNEEAGR